MSDRWGPDPTHRLWERWRRPVLLLAAVIFIGNQWERFASGQPFAIVTGVGVAAFWITVIFSRSLPEPDRRSEAEAWRTLALRRLTIFGSWTLVTLGWLGVAAVLYSVRPLNFVGPALPLLLTASTWWTYSRADRFADLQRRAINAQNSGAQAQSPSPRAARRARLDLTTNRCVRATCAVARRGPSSSAPPVK